MLRSSMRKIPSGRRCGSSLSQAGLAALLDGGYMPDSGERVGVVISGGNTVTRIAAESP
jgi:hypothetical protein